MNPSNLTELRTLVERAVRPVCAGAACKRKMREELLAHVMAAFEEEAATRGDTDAALERTVIRFGNPAELAGALQESVSGTDRLKWLVDQLWCCRGEPWWRRAFRQAVLIETVFLLMLLALWLGSDDRVTTWLTVEFRTVGAELAASFLAVLTYMSLGQWMLRALSGPGGRSWRDIVLISAICGMTPAIICGAVNFANGGWPGVKILEELLAAGLGMIWASGGMIAMSIARIRHDEEWERLPIT